MRAWASVQCTPAEKARRSDIFIICLELKCATCGEMLKVSKRASRSSIATGIEQNPAQHTSYIGSISASPTAYPLRGYVRSGTRNDRLGEAVVLSTGTPIPVQLTRRRRCRDRADIEPWNAYERASKSSVVTGIEQSPAQRSKTIPSQRLKPYPNQTMPFSAPCHTRPGARTHESIPRAWSQAVWGPRHPHGFYCSTILVIGA